MRVRPFPLVLLMVPAAAAAAGRAVPLVLNLQSRVLDAQDHPLAGALQVEVRVYDVADDPAPPAPPVAALWTAAYEATAFEGVFSVLLGDASHGGPTLDAAFFDGSGPRWVGISINGDAEARPRLLVGSVPFALTAGRALSAADADTVGGIAASATRQPGKLLALGQDMTFPLAAIPQGIGSGLDADKLDGLDASAFAPSSIESTVNAISTSVGQDLKGGVAAVATSVGSDLKGAVAAFRNAIGAPAAGGTLAAALDAASASAAASASSASAANARADEIKAALGSVQGATVAARADAAASDALAIKGLLGSPAGDSLAADIAAIEAKADTLRRTCPQHGETTNQAEFLQCYGSGGLVASWFVKVADGVPQHGNPGSGNPDSSFTDKVAGRSFDGICKAFFGTSALSRYFAAGAFYPYHTTVTGMAVNEYPVTAVFVTKDAALNGPEVVGRVVMAACYSYATGLWESQCGVSFANAFGMAGFTGFASFALPCTR